MAKTSRSLKFLSEAEIIAVNEEVVSSFGGLHGVRDLHLLHQAVARPKTSLRFKDAYQTVFSKAAALFDSIIHNHPFLDGNKRTALFAAILFLEYNGWEINLKTKEAVKFTRKAQSEKLSVEEIANWLESHSQKVRKNRPS